MKSYGQFPEQRVGVFVDVQNMYYSARALYSQKVNFQKLLEDAVGDRLLVRAIAYGITTEEAHEGDFHTALGEQGFEVKTKPLQTFYGGQKKGDWDVGIAVDVLELEPKVDVIVLISGDGDFVPLVKSAQSRGLRVEGMGFQSSTSSALVEVMNSFTDLSADTKRYLIPERKKATRTKTGATNKTTRGTRSKTTTRRSAAKTTSSTRRPRTPKLVL